MEPKLDNLSNNSKTYKLGSVFFVWTELNWTELKRTEVITKQDWTELDRTGLKIMSFQKKRTEPKAPF